jgi:hypothetical protein
VGKNFAVLDIFFKAYFGGSKGEQATTRGLLEVTSMEAALTGNDVT